MPCTVLVLLGNQKILNSPAIAKTKIVEKLRKMLLKSGKIISIVLFRAERKCNKVFPWIAQCKFGYSAFDSGNACFQLFCITGRTTLWFLETASFLKSGKPTGFDKRYLIAILVILLKRS